ncbi:MAG: hypothetical protein MJ134_05175 [Lachnospiraceae bacterium]|nr:hypothetical protein [Lachnospiraceae bacterium]
MEKDIKWKDYLKNPFRYADFINAFGFDGEQIVSAADITFRDTTNTDGTSRDNLVSTYTSFGKTLKTEIVKGEAKMCKAINDLIEIKLAEGKNEGKNEDAHEVRTAITDSLSLLGKISEKLQETINNQSSFSVLIKWLQIAAKVESIEQFEKNIYNVI